LNKIIKKFLTIPGESVRIEILPSSEITDRVQRNYKFICYPRFTIENVICQSKFKQYYNELKQEYTCGSLQCDLSLVKYIDSVSINKSFNDEKIFKIRWNDVIPSLDELKTSSQLKKLFDMLPLKSDDDDDEINEKDDIDLVLSMDKIKIKCVMESNNKIDRESDNKDDVNDDDNNDDDDNEIKSNNCVCSRCNNELFLQNLADINVIANNEGFSWICDHPDHFEFQTEEDNNVDLFYGCHEYLKTVNEDSISTCDFVYCVGCYNRENDELKQNNNSDDDKKNIENKKGNCVKPIESRFKIIQLLNKSIQKALPFINLNLKSNFLCELIFRCKNLIFQNIKNPLFTTGLEITSTKNFNRSELVISRSKASRYKANGKVDHDARETVFGQGFRHIHALPPISLRSEEKLFSVTLIGEHSQDAGGPYREAFDTFCEELQSEWLPLLLRCPNGISGVGNNRGCWILNSSSITATHLEMFAFVGKLLGIAIRSKEYLALNLPSIIWKLIINDLPTIDDLEEIDSSFISSLSEMKNFNTNLGSFSDIFFETFSTLSSNDIPIELITNGFNVDVTYENREEYYDKVIEYRLHEFDIQAAAIRRGLSTIVPLTLLTLHSWDQVEIMVCGKSEVDIKLLESITEYTSCSSADPHIRLFWQALSEFTNEERSSFIRFCWGRSRLPLNIQGFTQRFKINSFSKPNCNTHDDEYLPVAHTCFFSLELPIYSSLEILKEKLLYAILNCVAIDGDMDGPGLHNELEWVAF
jgi:hypothetical protein